MEEGPRFSAGRVSAPEKLEIIMIGTWSACMAWLGNVEILSKKDTNWLELGWWLPFEPLQHLQHVLLRQMIKEKWVNEGIAITPSTDIQKSNSQ